MYVFIYLEYTTVHIFFRVPVFLSLALFWNKSMLLFRNDALHWSKVTKVSKDC